jgi:hypothetical protein
MAPPISVQLAPRVAIFPLHEKALHVMARISNNGHGPANGQIALRLPAGWKSTPRTAVFSIARDGDVAEINFTVTPKATEGGTYTLGAVATYGHQEYTEGLTMAKQAHQCPYPFYRAATTQVRAADVRVPQGLRIGYIDGTGDDVPEALRQLGTRPRTVTLHDVAHADLSMYDAIVLGVRAYTAHPELAAYSGRLLDYVRGGGVLLVQYNIAGLRPSDAPWPLQLGDSPEKVVDEMSPVHLLRPQDPLLAWPNRITQNDFQGWVEERGHGFLRSWDAHYLPLLEMHDPGQLPQEGGLVYARDGKGLYIYLALALYRQMPEGVPGAYRIFADLISAAKNPALAGDANTTQNAPVHGPRR